jgi:hypothetical protein
MSSTDSFIKRVEAYENTAEHNEKLHTEFSQLTKTIPFIYQHRNYVETNDLGFGDPAFHYMWYLLIQHVSENFPHPRFLEIGVFKGQVISLWELIASKLNLELSITGISPLKGNPLPKLKWTRRLKTLLSSQFRKELKSANFYPQEDYRAIIADFFEAFNLQFSKVRLIEGYSNNAEVIETVKLEKFSVIYIDGDHTFEGVTEDIKNYSLLVENKGFLIMDDASYYIPGSSFWKGHETVSRACEIIPSLGFINVLNVGHNRIYQKVK